MAATVKSMNILFIGKRFYTNRDALREQYGRIYQLPKHWASSGISVELLLIDYHSNENIHENQGNLKIKSVPIFSFYFLKEVLKNLASSKKKYDIVIASGDCYIGLLAYIFSARSKTPFVFDVYDKYDEFSGYHSLPGFNLFQFLLKKSAARMFANKRLMLDIGKKCDIYLPNGIDPDFFSPGEKLECRDAFGLDKEKSLIGYFGGMEPDRGVSDLISAVRILHAENGNIELILGGKKPDSFNLDYPWVNYLGNIPYARMPSIIACCDLLAIPYRRSAFMDAGASNKIAESIACRKPIVATQTPNLIENFPMQAKQLSGLLAIPGDVKDLARVIRAQMKQQVLVDMPDHMTWDSISQHVASALSDLVHSNSAQP
jgi:glycosyltransferase involved in cell wall biosynthesis